MSNTPNDKELGKFGTMLSKVHTYEGKDFRIEIKFETSSERHMGGRTFHEVKIDSITPGIDYHKLKRGESKDLISLVDLFIADVNLWVDEHKTADGAISELIEMRFTPGVAENTNKQISH